MEDEGESSGGTVSGEKPERGLNGSTERRDENFGDVESL